MTDNVNDIYPQSSSLKAEDLKGRSVKVVIKDYRIQEFEKGKKLVLSFTGKEKTLVVNKTNAMIIASAYGSNPEGWVDNEIEVYPDKTTFQGKLVDCLRVRVPVPPEKPGESIPF